MTRHFAKWRLFASFLLLLLLANVSVRAAGSGAGAGGAGHQRAINMGLVPGEPGPPGALNNPQPAPKPQIGSKVAPKVESTPAGR